jgi:hypothetical protein
MMLDKSNLLLAVFSRAFSLQPASQVGTVLHVVESTTQGILIRSQTKMSIRDSKNQVDCQTQLHTHPPKNGSDDLTMRL